MTAFLSIYYNSFFLHKIVIKNMLDTVSNHEVEICETYQAMGFEMFVLLVTFYSNGFRSTVGNFKRLSTPFAVEREI